MSKHIKISLFDNNQSVEIVNDSVVKISYDNTDVVIRLSNISSMDYTEHKYIHKTYLWFFIIMIGQSVLLFMNYDAQFFNHFIGCVVLLYLMIGIAAFQETSSFLKLIVNKLVIKTHDDKIYTIRHFVNMENGIYKESLYKKHFDYNQVAKTLLDLKENIIKAKSKTII